MNNRQTIFALSSGQPPAAIAVVRISGPDASAVLRSMTGNPVKPRRAGLRNITDPASGYVLDRALVLWFPGPETATGEDLLEFHLHGGRAVVRAVEAALSDIAGVRRAEPGEFTRRAFENGRMDLSETDGLADLLFAESEWQRRSAMVRASGGFSSRIEGWRESLLEMSARVEAELDFSDEEDVGSGNLERIRGDSESLAAEITKTLDRPPREKLRDGVRVVLAGPPNAGKSTLLNALAERDAAIVSEIPGTTRDRIEVPMAIGGIPFVFVDTAGLRDDDSDTIEAIGMERAREAIDLADIVLWLGDEGQGPEHPNIWEIAAQIDRIDHHAKSQPKFRVSAVSGEGMEQLVQGLLDEATRILPQPDAMSASQRERDLLTDVCESLAEIGDSADWLAIGEGLRRARLALDAITGRAHTEDMLDGLFGRFCIGK